MAGCCSTFLFFSYTSGTIVYLLLGIFAHTGNLPLLVEHYQYNSNNTLITKEEDEVQKRTFCQYYLASSLTLIISLVLYIFCMREKHQDKGILNQTISLDMRPNSNNVLNEIDDEKKPLGFNLSDSIQKEMDKNNIQAITSMDNSGMGENEI